MSTPLDAVSSLKTKLGLLVVASVVTAVLLTLLGSAVRVDERQFARLHRLLAEVGQSLDATDLPEMYVQADPTLNAQTVGMDQPIIVLSSGLVHHLDDDELRFVIGHELGHAISGHAVYRTLLLRLLGLGGLLNTIPGGAIGIRMVIPQIVSARRVQLDLGRGKAPDPDKLPALLAELAADIGADRIGVLATQDAMRALVGEIQKQAEAAGVAPADGETDSPAEPDPTDSAD